MIGEFCWILHPGLQPCWPGEALLPSFRGVPLTQSTKQSPMPFLPANQETGKRSSQQAKPHMLSSSSQILHADKSLSKREREARATPVQVPPCENIRPGERIYFLSQNSRAGRVYRKGGMRDFSGTVAIFSNLDKGVGHTSACVCQNWWNSKPPIVCRLYLN